MRNSGRAAFLVTLLAPCGLLASTAQQPWVISRAEYAERLQGFWMAQCIANWTGLVTEMDRVEAPFYTDDDWGREDMPNMWGGKGPAATIDFFFVRPGEPWGSDDDTDIEYMYQHLHYTHGASPLSAERIRDGWLAHMWSDDFNKAGENFLWVSNENAYEAMRRGILPPDTSAEEHNADGEMIDAQLTTEIFGLFAPGRPDVALRLAALPIRTTARGEALAAAEFYVVMHALAARERAGESSGARLRALAEEASARLPAGSVVADMYAFVRDAWATNPDKDDWESTRDALYRAYQIEGRAGYVYRQPFDAAINFGASLVSLFYGDGDLRRTIRIGTLAGWDSDNPTATWGGLIGFLLGRAGVEAAFPGEAISDTYKISRTRRGFPDHTPDVEGEDSFRFMAERGLRIVDGVVIEQLGGTMDEAADVWSIPVR
jgi:hypothetical protein